MIAAQSTSHTELFALFDAFDAIRPWILTLTERDAGAAEVLKTWAAERGYSTSEARYVTEHCAPYANLMVRLGGCSDICILNYRLLTADEIAELSPKSEKRVREESVAHDEVRL